MVPWIKFERNQILFDEILSERCYLPSNEFEKSTLKFCKEWLSGQESFTLQTSGSTGVAKKIKITREQLKASANLTAKVLGLQKNDTALVCLDTRYIAGIMMMVRSFEVGMNMIIVEPASNPLEKIEEGTCIDFTALVPLQLETIIRSSDSNKLNQIKIALIGGAALNRKTVKDIAEIKCSFYATYGMTETISHIALQKLNGKDAQDYFEVLPGIALSKDERDCLIINAPHIANESIVTNDMIGFVSPSKFRWLGRADHVINSGGVKIAPEKIEASIHIIFEDLNISNRFFITALPDKLLGQSVNLFIEGTPIEKQTEDSIQEKIKHALSRYERPKSIRYLVTFVNTDTGKIDQHKTIALMQP